MMQTINEASISFQHTNNVVQVSFPDSGNASHHIYNILSGQDYPVLHCHFQPDCIIDIGANIGATALFFTDVYPNAECYCYEPSPSSFTYLERNTSFSERIKSFNCGLSNESSELKLYLGNSQCLQNSLYQSVEVNTNFEIATMKPASTELKEIMSGKRCLLKIDTEGCEVPILEEIKDYLDTVDILYLEYHSEEDRRIIDNLISSQFSLCWSKASTVHRGNVMYISQRLLSELPQLDAMAIRR